MSLDPTAQRPPEAPELADAEGSHMVTVRLGWLLNALVCCERAYLKLRYLEEDCTATASARSAEVRREIGTAITEMKDALGITARPAVTSGPGSGSEE